MNNFILISKFIEGAEMYRCNSCGHTVTKPGYKKAINCLYCGNGSEKIKNEVISREA